jgi:hypothetical protein
MPRKARIDAPGALHHIIVRGIEKKAIFRDVVDRKDFLKRLGAILIDTEIATAVMVICFKIGINRFYVKNSFI